MRIIQSYTMYNKVNDKLNSEPNKINFDVNLFNTSYLSYLTLKENCGPVTMYCDSLSYERVFKFIPYDDIVIIDPHKVYKNIDTELFWFLPKILAMSLTKEPSIHIDNDIFIFNKNIFKSFIESEHDMILQQIESNVLYEPYLNTFLNLDEKLTLRHLMSYKNKESVNCGVVGFKDKTIQDKYFTKIFEDIEFFKLNGFTDKAKYEDGLLSTYSCIVEQVTLYEYIQENKYNPYYILGKETYVDDANNLGFVHLWAQFKNNIIINNLVKSKIKKHYPEHYDNLIKFKKVN